MNKQVKLLVIEPGKAPRMASVEEMERICADIPPAIPKEYMMVGGRLCATPNEMLLATYDLWDDLAPGESVMLTKGGQGA